MSGSGDTASAPASAGSVAAGGGAAHTFQQAGPTQFRFRIGLGDFALLHGDLSTVLGKKKALQLVDLYPEPITSARRNTETEIYTAALEYARHCLGDDLSGLSQALAQLVQEAPASGDSELVNRVLTDLTHDAWLILPGTWTFTDDDMLGTEGGMLRERRRERESAFYAGNDALGKFPLSVHVELQRNGNWVPAARTQVQIQLVPPQPGATRDQQLDAAVALLPTTVEPPRPGWGRQPANSPWYTAQDGARGYVRRALDDHFSATDPQGVNVREQRGGLRGHALLNGIFRRMPAGPAGSPRPSALSGGRANAVKATTDDNGDLKFLFCPSRVTGDRYKLRIFVDPWDGNACDGTEARHPRIESGVFTVYKTVRFAGVTTKPVPAQLGDWYRSATRTLGTIDYSVFNTRLRKARLLAEHDGYGPQTWDEAGYLAALDYVRANVRRYLSGKKYDMDALLPAQLFFVQDPAVEWNGFLMGGGALTLRGHDAHATQVIDVRGTNDAGAGATERITLNGTRDVTGTTRWRSIASMIEHGANPVRFTVVRAGGNVEVHDSLATGSDRVTVRSTEAGDTMGLELFGTNGGVNVREALRLDGTRPVSSARTFDTLCGVRVRPKDDGTGHTGTIRLAFHGAARWPVAELAPGTDAVNVRSVSAFQAPHTFMMLSPTDYNALRRRRIPTSSGGTQQSSRMRSGSNGWWDYSDAITACANALAFYLTKNATGIAVTRALSGDPISVWGWLSQPYRLNPGHDGLPALPAHWSEPTTSGVATRFRAAHVWYPEQTYSGPNFPYDLTSNVLHEVGHVQFLRHQWTNVDGQNFLEVRQQGNGDGNPPDHDYYDVCVMSYHHCDGDYCGRCLLKLGGVKINEIPANH